MTQASSATDGPLCFMFDNRGHRLGGEIDVENRKHATMIADMTPEDWADAARMLHEWEAGRHREQS